MKFIEPNSNTKIAPKKRGVTPAKGDQNEVIQLNARQGFFNIHYFDYIFHFHYIQ